MPLVFIAFGVQFIAAIITIITTYFLPFIIAPPYSLHWFVLYQSILSWFITKHFTSLPCWWSPIQLTFPLLLYFLSNDVNPLVFLGIFLFLSLVFSNVVKERVPLYLTNRKTREALAEIAERYKANAFVDLGCGLGNNVSYMAKQDVELVDGVETAPIPYFIAKALSLVKGGNIYPTDMWKLRVKKYDMVYAFLSPEPMEKLWDKLKDELEPSAIFISNSFEVPGIKPFETMNIKDGRKTKLFIYQIPSK
jgi:SAM-dependent methyltransferase